MVLLAQNGKIPKDRSWKAGKVCTKTLYIRIYLYLQMQNKLLSILLFFYIIKFMLVFINYEI